MTQQQTQPTNATEARAALDAKLADKEWGDRYLSGAATERREFTELTTLIARGGDDVVTAAMAGTLSDPTDADQRFLADAAGWLRDHGFPDRAIHETLSGKEPTAADIELARVWKTQAMKSQDYVKRFLANDPDAIREMLAANTVLTVGSSAKALREAQAAAQ